MDNCNLSDSSQSEKHSEEEKVHKRRSSIFQRRVSVFNECIGDDDTEKHVSKTQQEESFDLEEYINSLRKERKEWIETLKKRKAERKNLTKKKLCLQTGQPLDLTTLSDSEKDFIMARPNYELICKNNNKLTETALKVSILYQIVYQLNKKFILQMEKRLSNVTHKIIEVSES